MSCCGSTTNTAVTQAVNDALANRIDELEGYSDSAAESAKEAAASATEADATETAIKEIQTQVQAVLTSAQALVPEISTTAGILQDTYNALIAINDALAGLLITNYYYTVVGGEDSIIIPTSYTNVDSIRALYIEGIRQDPGYGFTYDNVTRTIALPEPFPTEAAGSVVVVQIGSQDTDSPETIISQLASGSGAGMVGSDGGITVQTALDLKAPLDSPALTGSPTVPTPTAGDSSTLAASTAFVTSALSTLNTALQTLIAAKAAKGVNSDITQLSGLTAVSPLPGVTNASSASTGKVGEVITSAVSGTVLTSATETNLTSITLTPGDWDIESSVSVNFSDSSGTSVRGYTTTTSATLDDALMAAQIVASLGTGTQRLAVPYRRANVSVNTVIYLAALANSGSGTITAAGRITARRVR